MDERIRVKKIYVSSPRVPPTNKTRTFDHELSDSFQNVIGMEVTGWSLPNNLAPTFFPFNPLFPEITGDNIVDFSLSTPTVNAGAPTVFSFEWAPKAYLFSRTDAPNNSYTDSLDRLLTQAIESDPDFGDNVEFSVETDRLQRTRIVVTGKNALVGEVVTLTLLFLTGAGAADSAYFQMGFSQADYVSTLVVTVPPSFNTEIISPLNTTMIPRKFVDVFVDQYPSETHLVKRIYASNGEPGFGTEVITDSETRVRLFSPEKKIRKLSRLSVTVLLPNGTPPPTTDPYELEITLYILSVEDFGRQQSTHKKRAFLL